MASEVCFLATNSHLDGDSKGAFLAEKDDTVKGGFGVSQAYADFGHRHGNKKRKREGDRSDELFLKRDMVFTEEDAPDENMNMVFTEEDAPDENYVPDPKMNMVATEEDATDQNYVPDEEDEFYVGGYPKRENLTEEEILEFVAEHFSRKRSDPPDNRTYDVDYGLNCEWEMPFFGGRPMTDAELAELLKPEYLECL